MSAVLYIDAHGTKVGHRGGRIILERPDGKTGAVPVEQIDQVVVLGHAHFSHDAIAALLRRGVATVFSSRQGGFRGLLCGRAGRQVRRRLSQADACREPSRALTIARALVQAKLRGQGRLLHQWGVEGRHGIAVELLASHRCAGAGELRGHEGAAARIFFAGLRQHIAGSAFRFERREQHPPPDPVNALLSLLYTLLGGEVEVGIAAVGLDSCMGFFHAIDDGRPALSMDLVEPLRPLADRLAARLLRHDLTPEDFETGKRGCRLRDGRRGIVYKAWENLLDARIVWQGARSSWRRLIHRQALVLAHALEEGKAPTFWHLDAP